MWHPYNYYHLAGPDVFLSRGFESGEAGPATLMRIAETLRISTRKSCGKSPQLLPLDGLQENKTLHT